MTHNPSEPDLHRLVVPLTLAGALPFIACAVAAWRPWPLSFDPVYAAVVYAAVILSFVGGIQWATFLNGPTPKAWVIIASNLLALQGWVSVLLFTASPAGTCLFMAFGLLVAVWVDSRLYLQGFLPKNFHRLRKLITAIVVVCLVVTAAARHFAVAPQPF
jgi:hypothetical protein